MYLNTDHFARCIETLESSLTLLDRSQPDSIDYEIFRNAVVKGFELTLETGGKLLLPAFLADARALETALRERLGNGAGDA